MAYFQPVIIGIVRRNGKYLLTLRQDPNKEDSGTFHNHWQFPGGGLEFGETLEECLLRELREEVGIEVKPACLIPKIFTDVRKNWHGVLICYLCEMIDPGAEIVINEEASDFGWFTLSEIESLQQITYTSQMAELAEKL